MYTKAAEKIAWEVDGMASLKLGIDSLTSVDPIEILNYAEKHIPELSVKANGLIEVVVGKFISYTLTIVFVVK